MWPLRPRVTAADVLPHGPEAVPFSSVADPQFAFTCREARLSSISTESLSYGVLPPLDPLGVGSGLGALAALLPPELPPEAVSLELEVEVESSDEWLDAAEG